MILCRDVYKAQALSLRQALESIEVRLRVWFLNIEAMTSRDLSISPIQGDYKQKESIFKMQQELLQKELSSKAELVAVLQQTGTELLSSKPIQLQPQVQGDQGELRAEVDHLRSLLRQADDQIQLYQQEMARLGREAANEGGQSREIDSKEDEGVATSLSPPKSTTERRKRQGKSETELLQEVREERALHCQCSKT